MQRVALPLRKFLGLINEMLPTNQTPASTLMGEKMRNGMNKQHYAEDSDDSILRVGMLRINTKHIWKPQHTACAMMYTAKQFGIEMFIFHPDDVDIKTKTINGLFLERNEKVRRRVPFPTIIDNSIIDAKEYEEVLRQLEKHSVFIRHSLKTTKLRTYNTLARDGRFSSILIPTEKISTVDQLTAALCVHDKIIIKPASGGRGSGVRLVSKIADAYSLTEKSLTIQLDGSGLGGLVKNLNDRNVTYVWQPYIVSRTKSGNPFDVRIHARRGREGKFQVHLFPRIGNANGVVSNISTGGYSMDIDVFLKQEFGADSSKIKDELVNIGDTFPEYYQSFHDTKIFDVGMDVGIQSSRGNHSMRLFEVNTYIDGPFFEIEDAITHFEYFRFLEKNNKTSEIKS